MKRRKTPLFLERRSYRQRRIRDAATVVPILGVLLWTVPLLWPQTVEGGPTTARALLYIFGVWLGLTVLALFLASRLRVQDDSEPPEDR